jgi:hypothetical protein
MRKVEEAHQQIHTSLNHTQHKHSPTAATSHRSMGPGTVYRSANLDMQHAIFRNHACSSSCSSRAPVVALSLRAVGQAQSGAGMSW